MWNNAIYDFYRKQIAYLHTVRQNKHKITTTYPDHEYVRYTHLYR